MLIVGCFHGPLECLFVTGDTDGGGVESVPSRDALVIRLRPTSPDAMLKQAQKAFRYQGKHRLSVFADVQNADEDHDGLVRRLLRAAELSHIDPAGNPKFWFCESAGKLMDDGFTFAKDNYEGEEPEHYSIDLGNEPTLQDTEKLAKHFPESRSWTR